MDSLTMTLIRVDACNPHVGSAERYFRSVALIERQCPGLGNKNTIDRRKINN